MTSDQPGCKSTSAGSEPDSIDPTTSVPPKNELVSSLEEEVRVLYQNCKGNIAAQQTLLAGANRISEAYKLMENFQEEMHQAINKIDEFDPNLIPVSGLHSLMRKFKDVMREVETDIHGTITARKLAVNTTTGAHSKPSPIFNPSQPKEGT